MQTDEGLNYLAIREDFWGQMRPMYTKKPGLNFNNKVGRLLLVLRFITCSKSVHICQMVTQYEIEEKERQESNRRIQMDAAEGALMKNIRTIEHGKSII
jgi:hypothetical protein